MTIFLPSFSGFLASFMAAKRDAPEGQIPIVAHRRDYCDWVVIMYAKDWFKIYKDWEMGINPEE